MQSISDASLEMYYLYMLLFYVGPTSRNSQISYIGWRMWANSELLDFYMWLVGHLMLADTDRLPACQYSRKLSLIYFYCQEVDTDSHPARQSSLIFWFNLLSMQE